MIRDATQTDIGELNLPHGTNNQRVEKQTKNTDMLRSITKQSVLSTQSLGYESMYSVVKKKAEVAKKSRM